MATSETWDFPPTRRYTPVMGHDLKRVFYVFSGLAPQDCLADIKHYTCAMEREVAASGLWPVPRPVNLDPGLVTEGHLVLASTRGRGHRLPRADGIWEEITLLFFEGAFRPLMWTYADWRNPAYHAFFARVRADFMRETREIRARFAAAPPPADR